MVGVFDNEDYSESTLEWRDKKHPTRHNKTDYEAFRRRQQKDREVSEKRRRQRMHEVIGRNLEKWRQSVSARWKDADLKEIEREQSRAILKQIDEKGFVSFFFYGDTGIGKTYHAYAVIKEYIRRGKISPAQVVVLNEGQLLDYVSTGFEGRNKLSEVLSDKYKFYFIDDIGRGGSAPEDKRNAMWDRVMDHLYANDVNFVMTSNFTLKGLADNFSDAAFDRLMLKTMERRIEFTGGNYRHKLAKEERRRRPQG